MSFLKALEPISSSVNYYPETSAPLDTLKSQAIQVRVNPACKPPAPKIATQQKQIMRRLERLGILSAEEDSQNFGGSYYSAMRFQNPNTRRHQFASVQQSQSIKRPQINYEVDSAADSEGNENSQQLQSIDNTRSRIQKFKNAQAQFRTLQASSELSPSHQKLAIQPLNGLRTHIAYEEYNLPLPIMPKVNHMTHRNQKRETDHQLEEVSSLKLHGQSSTRDHSKLTKSSRLKPTDIQPRAQMLIPQTQAIHKQRRTSDQFLAEVIQTIEDKKKYRERGKIMQGSTNFKLPDTQALKKHLHWRDDQVKLNFVDQMSQDDNSLKGLINLSSSKERMIQRLPQDEFEQYVQNFCSPGSPNAQKSLKMIKPSKKPKVQQLEREPLKLKDSSLIDTAKKLSTEKQEMSANLESICSPNSQVISVGQDFLKKMSYVKFFKQKSQLDVKVHEVGSDPRIQYYLDCKKDLNLALPILDKIINKTLCLQNYTLFDGHCKSLARVFSLVDPKQLQGILLYNCGVDGKQFACILEGLQKLHDFKSITYKQNMFTVESLQALEPFLQRPHPQNLAELNLIDLKISTKCCEELLLCILRENYITKLSFVNMNLTERQFDILLNIIRASQSLEVLDLSWCEVRHLTYIKLFECLSQNLEIKSVVLQWNAILDEKDQVLHSARQIKTDEPVSLSPKNSLIIENICKFIQNNPKLILVDLQNTGLSELALSQIGSCLPSAVNLRSINLSGNPGINSVLIDQLRISLEAQPQQTQIQVKIYSKPDPDSQQGKQQLQGNKKFGVVKRKSTLSMDEKALTLNVTKQTSLNLKAGPSQMNEEELEKWVKLQEGIKMRNIQQISQINDLKLGIVSMDRQNLTISRKLGFEPYIENAAQWCINQSKQECYIGDQHMFTMVIWNQVIGSELCESAQEVKHYREQLGNYKEKNGQENQTQTPQIMGTFNDWQSQNMVDLLSFSMENDPNPPDFIWQLIEEGKCRQLCRQHPNEMDEDEAEALLEKRNDYYKKELVRVLKNISPFKHPQMALIDQLDAETLQDILNENSDQTRLWLWMDFVKPGRHTFCVRTPATNVEGIKSKAGFYVHKMWSQMRTESFPALSTYKKQRD